MICLIRGGGDLASGVAIRLHRVGLKVVMMEIPRPLAVRRLVSFSEAVYAGQFTIEEVTSVLVTEVENVFDVVYQTARNDLLELESLGFLIKKKLGKQKFLFLRSEIFEEKIEQYVKG